MVLYLYKDSKAVLASTMKGFFVMLVSSAALIPQLNFLGAGLSALIVYSVIGYLLTKSVRRHVQFKIKTIFLIIPVLYAVVILISLMDVELQYKWLFIVASTFLLTKVNKKFILDMYFKGV